MPTFLYIFAACWAIDSDTLCCGDERVRYGCNRTLTALPPSG